MAITPSLQFTSPSISPVLSFKTNDSCLSPFPRSHVSIRIFDRYSFPTVRSCQNLPLNLKPSAVSLNSPIVKAKASLDREPMVPPYNVLITGSTKGIGYAVAKEFLKAGDNVIICSRSAERVESAVQRLREEFGVQHVWGTRCDVRDGKDVKDLVTFAQRNLTYIDIWINNAGSNAYSYKPLSEASDEDLMQ